MKLQLEEKTQDAIDRYRAMKDIEKDEHREIIDRYKDMATKNDIDPMKFMNSILEELNAVKKTAAANAVNRNQKLKAIVEAAKTAILPKEKADKPADYQMRINNALQFLTATGEALTDESAFQILKDFTDDLEQMRLFRNIVAKYAELYDVLGEQRFPMTFKNLIQYETAFDVISEIELIAENLFLYPTLAGERYFLGKNDSHSFALPRESFEELDGESRILRLAKEFDAMAVDLVA